MHMKRLVDKVKLGTRYASDLWSLRGDDILLCSFPRSGNTWVRFMYCHLLVILDGHNIPEVDFPLLNEIMPAIGAGNVSDDWGFAPYPRLVKTHARWLPFFRGRRSVVLVRDPRDVMVSYYHFQKDRSRIYEGSFSSFIRHPRYGLRRWFNHLKSWHGKWDLVVTYEDLKTDTLEQFNRIIDFLGVDANRKHLLEAINRSKIDRIRRADKSTSKNSNARFARKGKTQQWTTYFSDEDRMLYQQLKEKYNWQYNFQIRPKL